VEQLLRLHEAAGSFLERPAAQATGDFPDAAEASPGEGPGACIGPYKLIEQIGEGGMGAVWVAQQTEPVKRLVAVKLVKAGMDSRQVVARFEAERQALALMDHPNIARVLDGGTTTAGRPYFVMDLVKGVPITRYCDEHRYTPRQRLELFVDVCQAVQHAHHKGIIHRDLKPSNVLVAPYDGRAVPKVIDFGVAKAAGQQLTERTLVTGFGAIVGTLEYMSPEQAELNNQDIDTRSDIYSLGVLLYELLTGSPPFCRKELEGGGLLETLRVIREQEPTRPSKKLSTADGLPTLAANRGTEPARLARLVRGELDWIVMKALEKNRSRRYETANGFAQDVQRYLADEPVLACPPSAGYRLRKFARRNKAGLAVAGLVLFFLVLLGGGIGWAVRDRAARHAKAGGQVESIFAEVDRLEREQKWPEALAAARRAAAAVAGGEADAATTERVGRRLKDLKFIGRLEQIRMEAPVGAERDRDYARAFRDYGVDVEELAVEASIERLRARPALAIPLAAALDHWVYRRRPLPQGDAAGWKRLAAVARGIDPEPLRDRLRSTWGRPVSGTKEELRRLADSIDIREQHPATLVSLAHTLQQVELPGPAVRILRDAQSVYPGDYWLNSALASALYERKDLEGAIRFGTAAASLRPHSFWDNAKLALALRQQGSLGEAVAVYRRNTQIDPKKSTPYLTLGDALREWGKPDEAVAAFRKAIELEPKSSGAYHGLGRALRDRNKLGEANAAFDTAVKLHRKDVELNPNSAAAYAQLGVVLRDQGRLDEAIDAFRKAAAISPQQSRLNLGAALHARGKLDEAIDVFRKGIEADPKNAGAYRRSLGAALHAQKKWDEAISVYRRAIELDPKDSGAYWHLGDALRVQNKLDEAVAAYRTAIQLRPKASGAYINLGNVLRDQKRLDEAVIAYRRAIELDQEYPRLSAHVNLGQVLVRQNKLDEAIAVYRKVLQLEPNRPWAHNDLAWILATRPEAALRDPKQAAALAGRAVGLKPEVGTFWNTLGAARYRAGDWKAAIGALEKSMALSKGGDSFDWFFLAMAHRQLGEQDKARQWYDRAVQWMDKNRPTNEELRRFRAEAAELLGLNEKQ
jgi:tetratricopeptide (TPR) repeat protein